MRIGSLALATIATALTASAQPAQSTCNGQACTFPLSFEDAAVYLVGTTGAAFSGQEQDTDSRTLPNGTHLSSQNARNMTYRDSRGRVRTDRHAYPFAPQGQPANPNDFVIAEIHDPVAGFVYVLDPVSKVAHRMAIPQELRKWDPSTITNRQPPPEPNATTELLGTQTISGITAYGEKTTSTWTPPNRIAVITTEEQWVDPATGVALLSKTTRAANDNVMTRAETNYSEAEPDASLFQIPAGYKTVDETAPFQVVHPQTGGGSNGRYGPRLTGSCEEGVCAVTFDPGNAPASGAMTGAPYSGHEVLTSVVNKKPFVGKYRDSNGRTRTDPAPTSGGLPADTKLALVKIEDPVAGYVYILSSATQTAYRIQTSFRSAPFQVWPMQPAATHTMRNGATDTIENLPPQTVSGVTATGQRNTTTYPPGTYNGNDQTIVTVNEHWIDPKTGVMIQTSNTGLRADITTTMPDYKEGDPDPTLFQIPADYKVVDETGKFSFNASVVKRP